MTLEEKVGQMTQYTSNWVVTGPTLSDNVEEELKSGRVGSIFNALTVNYVRSLQKIAVEETRMHIPLIFGFDVIHGYKTIFPLPLAEACSWDLDLIEKTAALQAKEAAAAGLNWTFNPMVDIARDPRWGRVAEGAGEDPYYGSLVAAAKVRGYQGDDLGSPQTVLACVKHFAAYGAVEAGREYNSVDMSERMLREVYLRPYHAAVDAGVGSVMTSFNDLDGIPSTANKWLMTDILRNEWGFKGFVVTDYTSMNELVNHGIAADEKEAALLAIKAGVDMDMQGADYIHNLPDLVKEGKVSGTEIDKAVYRILREKYLLGLFDDPYRYLDNQREKNTIRSKEMTDHALQSARESVVLLKNDTVGRKPVLPLSKNIKSIAVIGPLGDDQADMLGSWHGSGEAKDVVTLLQGIKEKIPETKVRYVQGCPVAENDRSGFAEALSVAKSSDIVILALGEGAWQNGEAASRSDIGLPGLQSELAESILATGKPVVAVIMAGRPLTISRLADHAPAIVNAWQLGTMAGPAIADILFGDYNPSGKLVISFPRNTGQIPVYYSMKTTGRPASGQKYTSKYLDIPNSPLYPFGYGLSYTRFTYSDLKTDKSEIGFGEPLTVSVNIKNAGDRDGVEVVQLYVRDVVASVTRPAKELKGFERIALKTGEEKTVTFTLTSDNLRFYDKDMKYVAEPGEFKVFAGRNAEDVLETGFVLK
ncbi:MAG: beta-glucosidase BglX [Chlorobi bacterium]|nr:beta-glucosidase BglX [Chlorobiota bacterium]